MRQEIMFPEVWEIMFLKVKVQKSEVEKKVKFVGVNLNSKSGQQSLDAISKKLEISVFGSTDPMFYLFAEFF